MPHPPTCCAAELVPGYEVSYGARLSGGDSILRTARKVASRAAYSRCMAKNTCTCGRRLACDLAGACSCVTRATELLMIGAKPRGLAMGCMAVVRKTAAIHAVA